MLLNAKNFVRRVFHRIAASGAVLLRGQHYDNATTTVENERHWRPAKDLPPITINNPFTRKTLRERARYECDNNCIAGGLVSTLATDTIGYVAPVPQVLTGDTELDKFLAEEWRQWSESDVVNLAEKLHVMDMARYTDGESFVMFITDTDETESETGYALNLVIVPQSRVTNPYNTYNNVEEREVQRDGYVTNVRLIDDDGVVVNAMTGRPHEFKVMNLVDEAQGYQGLIGSNLITISARYMKQWYRPKRPGQFRGISEIGPALGLFGQLRRFGLATLGAAEVAAMMTLILKTNLPVDESGAPTPLAPFSSRDFERNMVTSMPDGWDAVQMKAEHPISSYEMFVNMVLREIGRLLNVPFGIVAGDHSKYNYSSARLDVTGYDENKKYDRKQLCIRVLNPLHYEWLLEVAKRRPDVKRKLDEGKVSLTWKFTNRPSIDPQKDANVDDIRLKNGTTTYSEIFAVRGLDYREQFAQRAQEEQEKLKNNLDFSEKPLDKAGNSDIMNDTVPVANDTTIAQ